MKKLFVNITLAIVALSILPISGVEDVVAAEHYKRVDGHHLNMVRPKYVVKGENTKISASYSGSGNFDAIYWKWDVCGERYTQFAGKSMSKEFTFDNSGNCEIKIEVNAFVEDTIQVGLVEDEFDVLPIRNRAIRVNMPRRAEQGEMFWMKATYPGRPGYTDIKWELRSTGACKGVAEALNGRTFEVGLTANKKGICKVVIEMTAYYPNYTVKTEKTRFVNVK